MYESDKNRPKPNCLVRANPWGCRARQAVNLRPRTIPKSLLVLSLVVSGLGHAAAQPVISAWGGNATGQTTIPPGLTNVVAVSAGAYGSAALFRNRTVAAWGANGIW